jgi:hypothetical protein
MYPSSFFHDILKCQEGAPSSSSWTTIHTTRHFVRVNDVRLAVYDSAGNKVGAEGPLTNLGPCLVQRALAELEGRGMIEVTRGHGPRDRGWGFG